MNVSVFPCFMPFMKNFLARLFPHWTERLDCERGYIYVKGLCYSIGVKCIPLFCATSLILVEMGYSYGHYVNCPETNSDRHRFLWKKGCRELELVESDIYYSLRRAGGSYEALVESEPS